MCYTLDNLKQLALSHPELYVITIGSDRLLLGDDEIDGEVVYTPWKFLLVRLIANELDLNKLALEIYQSTVGRMLPDEMLLLKDLTDPEYSTKQLIVDSYSAEPINEYIEENEQ